MCVAKGLLKNVKLFHLQLNGNQHIRLILQLNFLTNKSIAKCCMFKLIIFVKY